MARAILKRSKVLVMDEVSALVSIQEHRESDMSVYLGDCKRRLCDRRAYQQNYPTVSSYLSLGFIATKHSMPVNSPLARYSLSHIDFVLSLIMIA